MIIYTDGSSRQKDGIWIGAIAYAIYDTDDVARVQESKIITPATINQCELIAIINGIYTCEKLFGEQPIEIRSDSLYVVDGFNKRKHKTNKEIWKLLHEITLNKDITITHVKAHADDSRNKHVDKLAKSKLRTQF